MGFRILFVERDVTTADLLLPSLERKGYQVALAQTQRQAMSRLRAGRPDLIVVDVVSFGAGGYKVSDAIRAKLDGVPAILLLGSGQAGLAGTADAFMTPPFTSRKLLYRVRRLSEQLISREIRAGSLVFDPDTRILRNGDVSWHLRPKEAALLAYFMMNPGRVLSREQIFRDVWETDYIVDTRTVSVHVCWLRTKIEEDPGAPILLRTVRGVGYRFEAPPK